MTDQSANAVSGPAEVSISGQGLENASYTVDDGKITINGIIYNGHSVSLTINPDGVNAEIYVNTSSASFYLQVL